MEGVYADTNLGLLLYQERQFERAVYVFERALEATEALLLGSPRDSEFRSQFIESLANLADAQENSGDLEPAMRNRLRQLAILTKLARADSRNVRLKRKAMASHRAVGRLFSSRGDVDAGLKHLRAAIALGEELTRAEPSNAEWSQWVARAHLDLGELLLANSQVDEAQKASRAACGVAERLVRMESSVVSWRTQLLGPCLLLRAKVAARRGETGEALEITNRALAISQSAHEGPADLSHRYAVAAARQLAGDQLAALGRLRAAQSEWERALAMLPANVGEAPAEQAQRFSLLRKLGRVREARRLESRLNRTGYRHPAYMRARNGA
jgi:tetratricopeptide (TPR) repeat protein